MNDEIIKDLIYLIDKYVEDQNDADRFKGLLISRGLSSGKGILASISNSEVLIEEKDRRLIKKVGSLCT